MTEPRGTFTPAQVNQLLAPIKPQRVLAVQGHSHVSQQDITAHLIRMFGFGNFDIDVIETALIFEDQRADPKTGALLPKWDVCYRALVRITVRNPDGVTVATYENGSTATAQNQSRGDGHDLAYKSAISLSIKRAAIALGDQFGLSLYNKGQLGALVIRTLVGAAEGSTGDLQDGIEQQVSLGNDEIDKTEEPAAPVQAAPPAWRARVAAATDMAALSEIHAEAVAEQWATPDLMAALTARKLALK